MADIRAFHRPSTLSEALALLAANPDAKPLAGGATLVAMMNARMLEPDAIVSLAHIAELRGITQEGDGVLRIGAFTRHCDTAAEVRLQGDLFVVRDAASQIANATVRNMGTIGGAIAFADPGLDYPPALVAARAHIEIASPRGRRLMRAEEFFVDWYQSTLEPGELVSAVLLPTPRAGYSRYHKLARVAGDYAIASVAIARTDEGAVRVAVGACGPRPLRNDEVDAMLARDRGASTVEAAARILVDLSDPLDDVRGSAEYRRLLIPRLLRTAVQAVP